MSNFTFFGSTYRGDLTLADISNTLNENTGQDIRGNSPHFNNPNNPSAKENKEEIIKKKFSDSPYLNSLATSTFSGLARVRKSNSVQKMRPVSPSPSLKVISEKSQQSNSSTKSKLDIPLLPKDIPLTELHVSEIRKKMKNYQPLTQRDRTNSWDRVLTEPGADVISLMRASQTACKATKVLKLKKKTENKTLLHLV